MARTKKPETAAGQLAELERKMERNRQEYAELKKQQKILKEKLKVEEDAEILSAFRASGMTKEDFLKRLK